MTDDWIQHRAETSHGGDVCVPHMVLPTDLGYMVLAFHVEGFVLKSKPNYCRKLVTQATDTVKRNTLHVLLYVINKHAHQISVANCAAYMTQTSFLENTDFLTLTQVRWSCRQLLHSRNILQQ